MKYRIIERNDGKFVIEFSAGFFQGWKRTYYIHFDVAKDIIFDNLKRLNL